MVKAPARTGRLINSKKTATPKHQTNNLTVASVKPGERKVRIVTKKLILPIIDLIPAQ
jgi:hypothetical protein